MTRRLCDAAAMHRLFVAIRPPVTIRAQLFDSMGGVEGARWQDDDQLHITLRFVGEVERSVAEDVAVALGGVRHPSFAIALDGIGQFDRRGKIDALWVGVTPSDEISALHRKVDRALVRTGLSPEGRAYLPHLTLARFSRNSGAASIASGWNRALPTKTFAVDHFRLFESHIGRSGARYEAIARYPLD